MSRSWRRRFARSCRTRSNSRVSNCGAYNDVREEGQAADREAGHRGDREDRRVGTDLRVELGADARKRVVHLERRAVARTFVEHVARE